MIDAILVLNAGSSSIKFSLFAHRAAALAAVASGQVEAIYTAPHFVAKDAAARPSARSTGRREPSSPTMAHSPTFSIG